jgi:ribonuclease Z
MHYKGLFAFGLDHTVVNVTKDRVWMREAALPETTNTLRPSMEWMIQNNFGGKIPSEMKIKNLVLTNQEKSVRDLEIDPALFTPKDQMRQWARGYLMPAESTITPNDLANFFGGPPAKK